MRNVEDKLRLVLLGHRRIKITGIAQPEEEKKAEKPVESSENAEEKTELLEETDVTVDKILKVSLVLVF